MAKHRVLIVDDDIQALRLLGIMLQRQGYEIVAASSGRQALEKAIESKPSIIILDIMMPGMDGYQVAGQLRKHPTTTGIPIMMFTAKGSISDKVAGFQAGADDYMTKPVNPTELIQRVEALLQDSDHIKEIADGNIASFLPSKGGIGSTTLALTSAIELKRQQPDKNVILVELRDNGSTLGLQLGMVMKCYLPPLLEQPLASVNEETVSNAVVHHESGVDLLLSAAKPVGMGPKLSKDLTRTLLYYLNRDYDYVILDLPLNLEAANGEALRLTHHLFLTLEPTRIGVALAQEMLDGLSRREVGLHKAEMITIHRMPDTTALEPRAIEKMLQRRVLSDIPYEPEMAYESIKASAPMRLLPHSLISQRVRLVVQSIVE